MLTNFKPEGYNCISPYFIVEDPQRFIDFLIRVFSGELVRSFNPDYALDNLLRNETTAK